LLGLDVGLLTAETRARMNGIHNLNNELIEVELRDKSDSNKSQIESIKGRLRDARKEYLSKKRERDQKNSELIELEGKQREEHNRRAAELATKKRTGIDRRGATGKKPVPIEPATADAPRITPILENRLSAIEGKLDNVLKALEDLKSKIRQ
jgi:septal ring factor EnvC (AmiA/AmiB activator)